MNQSTKELKAIDLMLLDLHTIHANIRSEAKELGCEDELNHLKDMFLNELKEKRTQLLLKE